jgi:hypothetical protein
MPDEDDGGVDDDDGGSASPAGQSAACTTANDCEDGLACYAMNHCTVECDDDNDCDDLDGAEYTCSSMGQCRVECADDDDCPDGLSCESLGGGGGGILRCVLP